MTQPKPLIMLGAGGHAKVLLALARAAGYTVSAVVAPEFAGMPCSLWQGVPVLGDESALATLEPQSVGLINGLGQMPRSALRRQVYQRFTCQGYVFPALVHPHAWVAPDVILDQGVQIMAGAVLQPACRIGENSVVNTGAQVDHDCVVGRDVHIAPGAVVCGGVVIGDNVFVGAGAVVIQSITIGDDTVIGAGSLIRQNVQPSCELSKRR